MQLARFLVDTVARWNEAHLHHRDLSLTNVGRLGPPDDRFIIWDYVTMLPEGAPHVGPTLLTRSQAFMAISVQQGEAPDVSTELESIYYLLIALCSISGDLYWQHSASGNSDAKVAAMFNRHTYNKEVRVQPCPHSRLAQSGIQQAFFSVIFQKASNWQEI